MNGENFLVFAGYFSLVYKNIHVTHISPLILITGIVVKMDITKNYKINVNFGHVKTTCLVPVTLFR